MLVDIMAFCGLSSFSRQMILYHIYIYIGSNQFHQFRAFCGSNALLHPQPLPRSGNPRSFRGAKSVLDIFTGRRTWRISRAPGRWRPASGDATLKLFLSREERPFRFLWNPVVRSPFWGGFWGGPQSSGFWDQSHM